MQTVAQSMSSQRTAETTKISRSGNIGILWEETKQNNNKHIKCVTMLYIQPIHIITQSIRLPVDLLQDKQYLYI